MGWGRMMADPRPVGRPNINLADIQFEKELIHYSQEKAAACLPVVKVMVLHRGVLQGPWAAHGWVMEVAPWPVAAGTLGRHFPVTHHHPSAYSGSFSLCRHAHIITFLPYPIRTVSRSSPSHLNQLSSVSPHCLFLASFERKQRTVRRGRRGSHGGWVLPPHHRLPSCPASPSPIP